MNVENCQTYSIFVMANTCQFYFVNKTILIYISTEEATFCKNTVFYDLKAKSLERQTSNPTVSASLLRNVPKKR